MDQTFTCVLLLLSLSATFAKYVYIEERKSWHEAQRYCRLFHTDLAPIRNRYDTRRLRRLAGTTIDYIWIGLVRNSTDGEKWTWSGGGGVSRFFWATGQPNDRQDEDYGLIRHYEWHDATAGFLEPFFCYNAVVVRERKTWEEALDYCREHHHDLASVASDTEMLLIQKELRKNDTTARVWIGLHFFPGSWLWVDGQPMSYEAWGRGGKPACPEVKMECAALQAMGGSQSHSGTDSTLVTAGGTGAVHANNRESVWEAHHCEERLHFICY